MQKIINYDSTTNLKEIYPNKSNILLDNIIYTEFKESYSETEIPISFIDNNVLNGPKFIDTFTIFNTLGTTSANIHNILTNDGSSTSTYDVGHIWNSIQSLFFSDNLASDNTKIIHPWKGTEIDRLHCIQFSNCLFKDQLEGFKFEPWFSITGNIGESLFGVLGFTDYMHSELTFSDILEEGDTESILQRDTIHHTINNYDNRNISYSFIKGRFYYEQTLSGYAQSIGILFKDYGLIVFFDLEDYTHISSSDWDDFIVSNYKSGNVGSITEPVLYLENNSFFYKEYKYETNFEISCPWYNCNYTHNNTIFDTSEYKYNSIDNLNDLKLIDETSWPRTYINTIYLFDNFNNLLATCSLTTPIKKDYLNEYTFKLKVKK